MRKWPRSSNKSFWAKTKGRFRAALFLSSISGGDALDFRALCDAADFTSEEAIEYLGLSNEEALRLKKDGKVPPSMRQVLSIEAEFGSRSRVSASIAGQPKKRSAISLFSGGGGLDIGIERAGFRTLACIEREPSKHFADERSVNEEELKEVRERILEKLERMRERELPEQLCGRCGEAMKAEAESPAMAVAD